MEVQIEAFRKLRPLCIAVTESGTRSDVKKLNDAVSTIEKDAAQALQDYILFPLRLQLRTVDRKQEITCDLVKCLAELLAKTSITSWKIFIELWIQIISLISHPKDMGAVADVSEELKLAVVKCITVLVDTCSISVLKDLYLPENLPKFGHTVFVFLRLAETELLRSLRIAAVDCLLSFGLSKRKGEAALKKRASQTFASFLPGISTTLARVADGDTTQGQGVTAIALQAWAYFVALVLGDVYLEDAKDDEPNHSQPEGCRVQLVVRSPLWVQETVSRLRLLVDKMVELVCHGHWRVRLALVAWAEVLLLKCGKSFSECQGPLLDVVLTLTADDMGRVAERSQGCLVKISASHCHSTSSLTQVLEDNLLALATRLPRVLRGGDDDKKLATLHLLTGYIQMLGSRIQTLLLSALHLERLGLALVQLVELDCSHVQLVAERTAERDNQDLENNYLSLPKKFFKHFRDERVYCKAMFICRLLGCYGDVDLLLDHLFDLFHESIVYRKQAALLINEVVLGAVGIDLDPSQSVLPLNHETGKSASLDKQRLAALVRMVMDEYLQPVVWNLPTHFEESNAHVTRSSSESMSLVVTDRGQAPCVATSFEHFNSNILLICILLEGIGNCSRLLGSDFGPFLITALYPLLEKMGDLSAVVMQTAFYVANVISTNIGTESVAEMISKHADYLVNSVSLKLRHVRHNPEAPTILKVAVQNSGAEILPFMYDSFEELLQRLDEHPEKQSLNFMAALNGLVCAVVKWFPYQDPTTKEVAEPTSGENSSSYNDLNTSESDNDASERKPVDMETIRDYFTEYHRLKQLAEGDDIDDYENLSNSPAVDTDPGETDANEEKQKVVPSHVELVIKVMKRCVHLVSSHEQQLCILVLDTIAMGTLALRDYEDELLPMVHKLWKPLVYRFSGNNLVVKRKAFCTLCVMSDICGDFIRTRTVTDVWPHVVTFLEQQSSASYKSNSAFHFTAAYKLQLDMLNSLGMLAQRLKLQRDQCENLIGVCVPYLNVKQPRVLQEAALLAFDSFLLLEPDIVWLHLYSLPGLGRELVPPHPVFPVMVMCNSRDEEHECQTNAAKVMTKMK